MPLIQPSTKRTAPTKPQMAEQRDMGTIALCAWLDFQLAKCDIDTINERIAGYHTRLDNAAIWFETHGEDDPDYKDAYSLLYQIGNDAEDDRAIRQMRARGAVHHLWNAVMATASVAHYDCADELQGIVLHLRNQNAAEGIVAITRAVVPIVWREQLPTTPLPTYMPDDSRTNWVEYRLGAVPTWSLDELQETLEEKRQR